MNKPFAALFMLASIPCVAQTTGVSNPDPVTINATDETPAAAPAKPSAAIPAATPTQAPSETYGPYVPLKTAPATKAVAVEPVAQSADVDGQIVLAPPDVDGQISEGTLLHVRVNDDLSTGRTTVGTPFTAELMQPIEKNGHIVLPIGSVLHGQVTESRTGRRISGKAALHLETRNITLPDGSTYVVHAQLTDTSQHDFSVDPEGTLKRRDHTKKNLAIIGLSTGGGAATGALIGGGVGAAVGAGIGAGVSTVMWLSEDRQATLWKDDRLTFSLTTPIILTPLASTADTATGSGTGPALRAASN